MRTWKSDPRFHCPLCGKLIELKYITVPEEAITVDDTAALCPDCHRVFMVSDWRKRHGGFRPRSDVGPGPASPPGEP